MGTGTTRGEIDPYLRMELRDTVFKNVSGFHTFFPTIDEAQWKCAVSCLKECTCPYENEHFESWPKPASQKDTLDWFMSFNSHLDAGPTRFYTSGNKGLSDSDAIRKGDVFLSEIIEDDSANVLFQPGTTTFSWLQPRVIGELKEASGQDCNSGTIVQLASYAREIFAAQVCRRFVHGFTVCGDAFRAYLFDRAGISISEKFRINKNKKTLKLFAHILLGYARMNPQNLGFDSNYKTADGKPFVPCGGEIPRQLVFDGYRFNLTAKLFQRKAIVCRATLCWLATDEEGKQCVVKDMWRSKLRESEGELLSRAKVNGWDELSYKQHWIVCIDAAEDTTLNIRKGLSYDSAKEADITEQRIDRLYCLKSVISNTTSNTTGSDLSQSSTRNSINSKRQPEDQGGSASKRLKSETSKNITERSRVHEIVVTCKLGRPIYKFRSPRELIQAFRGAIECMFLWSCFILFFCFIVNTF